MREGTESVEKEIDRKLAEAEQARKEVMDADEIERQAKMHAEAAEAGKDAAEDELAARRIVRDGRGRQLRFEGLDVMGIKTQFKGTVKLEVGYLKAGTVVRFEGTAVVNEIDNKNKDGWTRYQVLSPQSMEIVSDALPNAENSE